MRRSHGFLTALVVVLAGCTSAPDLDTRQPIEQNAQALLSSFEIPAIAWALIVDGEVAELGATGVSVAEGTARVTIDSRFHMGSNTKSATALLAGIAVDRGLLSWDSTVGMVLGEHGYDVPPEYREITITQLLSHTAGVPSIMAVEQWNAHFVSGDPADVQRRSMVQEVMELPPDFAPAARFSYSNMGVVVAGAMIEAVMGNSWEALIQTELYQPLGLTKGGFGPPGLVGAGEPWGHAPAPVDPQRIGADNPAGLGPAGTMHASIRDLASYAQLWTEEGAPLLSQAAFGAITTPVHGDAALGWFVYDSPWGTAIAHDGSNTMFYSTIRVVPEADLGVVVVSNSGAAEHAVSLLAEHLVERAEVR